MMGRLGLEFIGDLPIQETVSLAKLAEEKGFESVWVAEDYFYRGQLPTLSAIALATKRINLVTGIMHIFVRPPPVITMSIAALDELCGGRAVLGLGVGYRKAFEEWMGLKFEKPAQRMKEYVKVIRELLAGKVVNHEGETVRNKGFRLGFKPVRDNIPIYVAATGERMLNVAGEVGDGVALNCFTSPEFATYAFRHVESGATKAGRRLADIDLAALLVLSVSDDREMARKYPRAINALYFSIPEVAEPNLRHGGLEDELDKLGPIREAVSRGDIPEAARHVSDAMVDNLTISGTPRECREKLQDWMEAGVKLPVLFPVGPNIRQALEAMAEG